MKLIRFLFLAMFASFGAYAQELATPPGVIYIGEVHVWDCGAGGGSQYENDAAVAQRFWGRLASMSSIHWALGPIRPDYTGEWYLKGPAKFSVGVYEGSSVPKFDYIVSLGKYIVQCGEFVVGDLHVQF